MKIKTALILCAGFGKRLLPLTSKTPKPLLKIKNITLLERTLNIIKQLEIKNVKINTFHLENEIVNFLSNYKSNINIDIIKDGKDILDTGGGIINLIKSSTENDFIVFNPDTIWDLKYKDELEKMIEYYYSNKLNNLLLVVNKNKSFDKRLKGDFELKNKNLVKYKEKNYIYIGCQIINKKIFQNITEKSFSISKIWNTEIDKNNLNGFESKENFIHVTDLEIYNKLTKN
jgi:MurNAc alpha-1-phosphate uridylyltransferase